jgi:hypothetical protein
VTIRRITTGATERFGVGRALGSETDFGHATTTRQLALMDLLPSPPPSHEWGLIVRAVHRKRTLLQVVRVKIEINGMIYKCQWGDTLFHLEPGRYEVSVSCRWLFYSHLGLNSIEVTVLQGRTAIVQWTPPILAFHRGVIQQLP